MRTESSSIRRITAALCVGVFATFTGLADGTDVVRARGLTRWVHVVQPEEPLQIVGYSSDSPDSALTTSFLVKNVSDSPVYAFTYVVNFETSDRGRQISFTLMFGDKNLNGPTVAPPDAPSLAPGKTIRVGIPAHFANVVDRYLASGTGVMRGELYLAVVNRGQGNDWVIRIQSYEDVPAIAVNNSKASSGSGAPPN